MTKIHGIPLRTINLPILLLPFLVIISGCRDSASNYFLTPGSDSDSSSDDGSNQGTGGTPTKVRVIAPKTPVSVILRVVVRYQIRLPIIPSRSTKVPI